MGVKKLDKESCDSCGLCIEDCPMDVFATDSAGKVFVAYPHDCWECLICETTCPHQSIEISPASCRPRYFPC